MMEHFEVVVVGAGPGGLAAAVTAAEAGKRVCLIDAAAAPGGQIWKRYGAEHARKLPFGNVFLHWMARLNRPNCQLLQGFQVIDSPMQGCLRLESESESRDIEFESLILATGARERFLPFPGWTLPAVMGAGGAQALVKAGLDPRGKRVVVSGSGPLLLAVAAGLAGAGAKIEGIFEQAPFYRLAALGRSMAFAQPGKLIEGAKYRLQTLRAPYRFGSWVVGAEGRGRVERVTVANGHSERTIECDWLACGFHLVPNLELPRLLGCSLAGGYVSVDPLQRSSVPNVFCVGELTGIGGMEKALIEGQIAGMAAVGRKFQAGTFERDRNRAKDFARRLDRAFDLRPELRDLPAAKTVVCRCEDVTHQAIAGCNSWREAKLHTRCGMGACQGRVCGAATEFLHGWGPADARPPAYPARTSTLAAKADTTVSIRR